MREILLATGVAGMFPAATTPTGRIAGFVAPGTRVADAHPNWRPEFVATIGGLPPFPRRDAGDAVPEGIVRVEIDAVEYRSGGMSSHYGWVGVFASVLVSIPDGAIWDARSEPAY